MPPLVQLIAYVSQSSYYRYDIGNCLFEAAYDVVLDRCNCTPYFHWGVVDLETILANRPFCKVWSHALVYHSKVLYVGTVPALHEPGVWEVGGDQHHQAGEQDRCSVPGSLRGSDQPDIHLTEQTTQQVRISWCFLSTTDFELLILFFTGDNVCRFVESWSTQHAQ